jgi:hypothetical protein
MALADRLKAAIERGDWETVSRLRREMRANADVPGLLPTVEELGELLEGILLRRGQTVGAGRREAVGVINQKTKEITKAGEAEMRRMSRDIRREVAEIAAAMANPREWRAITQLPIDRQGKVIPKPGGNVPSILSADDEARDGRGWLFRLLSPWLHMDGADELGGTPEEMLPLPDHANEYRGEIEGGNWLHSFGRIYDGLKQRIASLVESVLSRFRVAKDAAPADFQRRVQDEMKQVAAAVKNELEHRGNQMDGEAFNDLAQRKGVAGYTLYSRFMETTAADHAARDGWKFFKDDRPGSNKPWAERIIPPYRKNCVCFTIPLIELASGEIQEEPFGIRLSRGEQITIRDVGQFSEWYGQQRPGIKRKVVGEELWDDMSEGIPDLKDQPYEFWLMPNGELADPELLAAETNRERQRRINQARIVAEAQSRRFRDAWEAGDGRWDGSDALEREYLQRLDDLLSRLSIR